MPVYICLYHSKAVGMNFVKQEVLDYLCESLLLSCNMQHQSDSF